MAARLPPGNQRHDGEYEDLLSLWSDLESALSVVLSAPLRVQDFPAKVRQIDRWLQDLVAHDIDAALYLMFQLASTSSVGYSASHALVCGTLCHIMAQELQLPPRERDSLVRAALTMNIGMTALQDVLAEQREKPTAAAAGGHSQSPPGKPGTARTPVHHRQPLAGRGGPAPRQHFRPRAAGQPGAARPAHPHPGHHRPLRRHDQPPQVARRPQRHRFGARHRGP
jgi:hypothetical protein